MENIVARWRRELRGTFSANSTTIPQWELDLEKGDDGGYFAPDSAAWAVHGSMTTLVAGIHALLLQALHPGAMAGVHDHSDYKSDPLGRLAGTIRWIYTLTYGDTAAAQAASQKVLSIHRFITGTYTANNGQEIPYTAHDPDLLRWVHLAFTEAFLASHKSLGTRVPGGPDAYVADWAIAGKLMGVDNPPVTEAQLNEQLHAFTPELRYDQRVADTVAFLRNPPLPRSQQRGYKILFAAAVETLPATYRTLLQLEPAHWGPFPLPVREVAKLVLAVVHLGLGKTGPSEQSARARRNRLGLEEAHRKAR
ncbi:oxygenase MpaB family protein [Arthrobacter sp. GMC3]|uniref:oxygenase MpaB family protein n=1 Tax=Arthrobacter sp. GMC3 TaxID=2058894 RepID=UPI000CE4DFB1|nr:oxygenase MpaB family protein [Arthrobacter sp. GMC3]